MVHQILEDSEKDGTESIVAWVDDGTAFHIHKPKVFNDVILPKYSRKKTKFRSFQRQLNIYGFKMTKKSGLYRHELFRRGDLHSIAQIRPRTQPKKRSNSMDVSLTPSSLGQKSDEEESRNQMNSARSPPLLRCVTLERVELLSAVSEKEERAGFARIQKAIRVDDHSYCSTVGSGFDFELFDDLEGIKLCDCNGGGCCFSSRQQ